jgi:hypothetical protein
MMNGGANRKTILDLVGLKAENFGTDGQYLTIRTPDAH